VCDSILLQATEALDCTLCSLRVLVAKVLRVTLLKSNVLYLMQYSASITATSAYALANVFNHTPSGLFWKDSVTL